MPEPTIGVVGATGAVGTVTLELLAREGYENVRVFASARSAGTQLGRLTVEEATPEALSRGDVDVFLFSVGTGASRELVPHAVARRRGRDRQVVRVPARPALPARRARGERRPRATGEIIANPNCCTIPLTCVLKPLHDAVGLTRVRVATYQSVSGAGAQSMERLRNEPQAEHDLRMDWDFDGEEFDEESKLRAETQKIMELPDLPIQATCVRVPVMVGHAEAVWIETEDELTPEQAKAILGAAPSVQLDDFPSPGKAAGGDDVLVGRIRRDPTVERGLALFLACDNLRKGAALNAIQIAQLVLPRAHAAARLVDIGMLGRFFGRLTGGNWRPPAQELAFAASAGFDTVQIRSDRHGEIADELGIDPDELGALFDDHGLEPVLEMLVRHDGEPGTFAASTPARTCRRSRRSGSCASMCTRSARAMRRRNSRPTSPRRSRSRTTRASSSRSSTTRRATACSSSRMTSRRSSKPCPGSGSSGT